MASSKIEIEKSSDEKEICCDLCRQSSKETLAVVYCRTCQQFLCESCNGIHKIPSLSKHTIVDVENNAAGKREFDMQNLDRCKKHNKQFKFYCKVDNELCCSTCAISNHIQKCGGVVEIDTLIDTNNDEMQKIKSKIQGQKFLSTVLTSSGSSIKAKLHNDQADKLQQIDKVKQRIVQKFDSFKAVFKRESDKAITDIELDIDSEQASLKWIYEHIDTIDTFLDDVANEGTTRQFFTALNIYNARIEQFEKELDRSCEQLRTFNIDFRFKKQVSKLQNIEINIGELTIDNEELYKHMRLLKAKDVDLHSFVGKEYLLSGIDFISDGRIAAVDNLNHICLIMNLPFSMYITRKVEPCPYGVAGLSGNTIAVSSSGNKLSMYTVHLNNTMTKLNTFTTTSPLASLCRLDDRTLVASTIDTKGPVKKVSTTGEETDFIRRPWQPSTYALDQSKTRYIPSLDMLVVTDQQASKCYLWNLKDRSKNVVEDERIRQPTGVCASKSGIIFVCSSETNSIVQISPTGKVLGSTPLSVISPNSVAISHDDKYLLVYNGVLGIKKLQLLYIC